MPYITPELRLCSMVCFTTKRNYTTLKRYAVSLSSVDRFTTKRNVLLFAFARRSGLGKCLRIRSPFNVGLGECLQLSCLHYHYSNETHESQAYLLHQKYHI